MKEGWNLKETLFSGFFDLDKLKKEISDVISFFGVFFVVVSYIFWGKVVSIFITIEQM